MGRGWKRDYGAPYTGTQGETPDTAKGTPTDYRASPLPDKAMQHIGGLIRSVGYAERCD